MVDRIASFSQTSQLVTNNLRLETDYSLGQLQISSGYKATSYEGIAEDTGQIMNLESEYKRLSTQSQNAQIALDRTEVMYSTMGRILDEVRNFLPDLNGTLSGTISSAEVVNQAQTSRDLIVASLNEQFDGRYLFSGSATNVPPVDLAAPGYGGFVTPSSADTTYYQGNDFSHSVEISDNYTITYGVTADHAAFEQVLRAIDLVITTPTDEATLQEAYGLLQTATDELAELQAQTSQDSTAIDRMINDHVNELNLIDNLITELTAVDLAAVSVKIAELDAQLQASYSVTADLLRLNLSDFLR